jgi:hypothetical protein
MKRIFCLTITLFCFFGFSFGQNTDTSSAINIRGHVSSYYVDGFKAYPDLTEKEKRKVLKEFVKKLNGCWLTDSTLRLNEFKLSTKTFSGTWLTRDNNHPTTFKTRIELTNSFIRIVNSDNDGKDIYPGLINIFGTDKLVIDLRDKNGTQTFTRQKSCP